MGDAIGTTVNATPPAGVEAPPKVETKIERPAWLPEKFKTAEDMAKSYAEAEKKISELTRPAGKTEDPKAITTPPKVGESVEAPVDAEAAVKKAGLDLKALQKEYDSNGDLTPETKAKLAEVGIGDVQIEVYKNGLKANGQAFEAEVVKGLKGGKEALTEAIDWAVKELAQGSLSQADVDAFNSAMESGNAASGALAAEGLVSKFRRSQGPVLIDGSTPTDHSPGYSSRAQQLADMGNPLYKTDAAFRDQVLKKSINSKF